MTLVQEAPSIMQRLREETRSLHDAAERSVFQQALAAGKLPREGYVDSLAQLLCIHCALETHLRRCGADVPAIGAVIRDHQFQEQNLRDDLRHFGRDPESVTPMPAARDLVDSIDRAAAENPVALLGYHYVLEGSKNGAKFIAARVRAAYGLNDSDGTRCLDPYGPRQRERWIAFRQDMDAVGFSRGETTAIFAAAATTFAGLTRLYDDLWRDGEAREAAYGHIRTFSKS